MDEDEVIELISLIVEDYYTHPEEYLSPEEVEDGTEEDEDED